MTAHDLSRFASQVMELIHDRNEWKRRAIEAEARLAGLR